MTVSVGPIDANGVARKLAECTELFRRKDFSIQCLAGYYIDMSCANNSLGEKPFVKFRHG